MVPLNLLFETGGWTEMESDPRLNQCTYILMKTNDQELVKLGADSTKQLISFGYNRIEIINDLGLGIKWAG